MRCHRPSTEFLPRSFSGTPIDALTALHMSVSTCKVTLDHRHAALERGKLTINASLYGLFSVFPLQLTAYMTIFSLVYLIGVRGTEATIFLEGSACPS